MTEKLWYITNTGGVFTHLSNDDKKHLAGISKMEECPRGNTFYFSNDLSDKKFIW